MSYANPRPAKLKKDIETKVISAQGVVMSSQRAGARCQAQRNPSDIGSFVLYFGKRSATRSELAKVPAEQLADYIDYTDGKPEGFNF